jgi:hypothetical protein
MYRILEAMRLFAYPFINSKLFLMLQYYAVLVEVQYWT